MEIDWKLIDGLHQLEGEFFSSFMTDLGLERHKIINIYRYMETYCLENGKCPSKEEIIDNYKLKLEEFYQEATVKAVKMLELLEELQIGMTIDSWAQAKSRSGTDSKG